MNQVHDLSDEAVAERLDPVARRALQEYRDGKREHALMSAQAKDLNDQQIADLAAYFASRPGQLGDLSNMEQ